MYKWIRLNGHIFILELDDVTTLYYFIYIIIYIIIIYIIIYIIYIILFFSLSINIKKLYIHCHCQLDWYWRGLFKWMHFMFSWTGTDVLPRMNEGSDKPSATIEPRRIMVPTRTWTWAAGMKVQCRNHCTTATSNDHHYCCHPRL